jgi:hypothetical protein
MTKITNLRVIPIAPLSEKLAFSYLIKRLDLKSIEVWTGGEWTCRVGPGVRFTPRPSE